MKKILLLSLVLVLSITDSLAGWEPIITAKKQGNLLKVDSTIYVEDDKWNCIQANNCSPSFKTRAMENAVVLGIDQDFLLCQDSFWIEFDLEVKSWDTLNQLTTKNITLKLNYHPNLGVISDDKSIYKFEGFSRVQTRILAIRSSLALNAVPENVYLENLIKNERFYDLNYTSKPTFNNIQVLQQDELLITWTSVPGAFEYDLEWLFIDDFKDYNGTTTTYKTQPQLWFNFKNNATRITTKNPEFILKNGYEHGYLVFRVRAVNYGDDDFLQRFEADWTTNESNILLNTFGTINKDKYFISVGHEPNLNWQWSLSFAEEAKNKVVISYFDGTLRSRQMVTQNNSDHFTIVGESVFDHVGRKAIDILPVPAFDSIIKFYPNFNLSIARKKPYSWRDFDSSNSENCNYFLVGMDTISGASRYYSPNNPQKINHQAYVPNAELFPFVQTEFTPDMTGRVRRQGGLGEQHKLGSGHESFFYYGSPTQTELDRLFGVEVGYAKHYKKNLVVDPNGSVSVSYLNPQGNVIATALAGLPPENLNALVQDTGTVNIVANLSEKNALSISNERIFSRHSMVVSQTTPLKINYSFKDNVYSPSNCGDNICYDCTYDLKIQIFNDCGIQYLDTFIKNIKPFDTACSIDTFQFEFETVLPLGLYEVHKELIVNKDSLEKYVEIAVSNNSCLKTVNQIYDSLLLNIDYSGCEITCEECIASLGTRSDFIELEVERSDTIGRDMDSLRFEIGLTYDQELKECKVLCNENFVCESELIRLKKDVSPGGQYFLFNQDTLGNYYAGDSLSLGSTVPDHPYYSGTFRNWKNINLVYLDDFYDTIYVKLNDSTYLKPNELSLKEFIENFDPIWANELVKMHPEYCYYQWCVENQEANTFIGKFMSQEFYPKAVEDSLINPVNVSGQPGYNQSIADPLFESGAGAFMKADFKNKLENYYSIDGEFFSIWEFSAIMHFCPDFKTKQEALNCLSSNPFASGDIADKTMQWSLLKGFYVSERGKYADSIRILYANSNGCSNCYIGNGIDSGYQFSSSCSTVFTNSNYLNKAKIYQSNSEYLSRSADFSNINQIADDNKDSLKIICENSCLSYVNQWVSQLKYCQNFNQDSAQIIDSLLKVCQLSCDGSSAYGKDKIAYSNRPLTNNYNFADALKSVWGNNYMDSICNDDVIHLNVMIEDRIESGFTKADSCGIEWFKSMVQNSGCSSSALDSMLQLVLNKISEKGILNTNNNLVKLDTVLGVTLYNGYKAILQGYNFINSSQIDYFKSFIDTSGQIRFSWISNYTSNYDTCNLIIKKTSPYNFSLDSIRSIPVLFNSSFEKSYCITGKSLEAIGFDNDFNEINLQIISECYPKCNDSFSVNTISDYIFSQTCTYVDPSMIRLGLYALCNNNADFYVPIEFSCKPLCLTCDKLIQAEEEFENKYDGIFNFNDSTLQNDATYAEVYENFMNKKFGFFQHFDNYQWLKNNCDSFYQEPVETPEGQAINYFDYPTYLKVVKNCEPFDSAFTDSFFNKMVLCDAPIFDIPVNEISCDSSLRIDVYRRAQNIYYNNLEAFKNEFRKNWMEKCLAIDSFEDFKLEYQIKEYHFTLYYYDQAGNLIKTVPPKGVNPITNPTTLNTVKQNRKAKVASNSANVPAHTYVTRYHYNTLGLLTEQETPDGGLSKFYYDRLGRLVVSQNAKQKNDPKTFHQYSYTLYDDLGRIIQVGETSNSDTMTDLIARSSNSLKAWINGAEDFKQITSTFYDDTLQLEINNQFGPNGQQHLRGRVSFMQIDDNGDSTAEYTSYFDYDIHGNVKQILHRYEELIPTGWGYFKIGYKYDLISGNVLEVSYQKSKADQFYHQYEYDADNRIILAKTSRDGLFWDDDARYKYYQNGPLSRAEIGHLKVQGMDYAYTIHGWLKGMNSYSLDSSLDIGKDGWKNSGNLNQYVPKDEFGFVLGYYQGDYKDVAQLSNQKKFEGFYAGGANSPNNLYNGNIRYMNVSIDKFMGPNNAPINYVYRYDQLNRIVSMYATDSFNKSTNSWFAQDLKPYYHNRFTYDANGNILSQVRKGTKAGPIDMDSLVYHYQSGNNQLLYVDDNVNASNYNMDIDDQSSGNYRYDLIGNLVEDHAEEIDTILWNVYGKVKAIYRNEGSQKPNLEFTYGPDGQRLSKRVIKGDTVTTEFYVRDASGNIMARYSQEVNILSVSQIPTDSNLLNATVMVLEDTIDISSMSYEEINSLLRNNVSLPAIQPWAKTMADYYCSSSSFNSFKSQMVSWLQGSGNELSFIYQFSPTLYLPSNSYYFNLVVDNFDYSSFINAMFSDNSSDFIEALWQADAFDLTNSFLWVSKYSFITHIAYNDFALFDAWYTSMGGPPQPTLDDSINFLNGIPNLALTGGLLSQNPADVKNMMVTYGVAIASIEYFHTNGNDVRAIIKATTVPYYTDSQIATILINYDFREVINTIYYNASVINNLTNWLMNNHCDEFVRKFAQNYPVNFDNLQTAYLSSDISNYKSFLFTTYGAGVISATGQYLYLDVLTPADKVISYYSYTFTPLLQKQKSLTLKEHHIYGSSRLGYQERNTVVHSYDFKAFYTENSYIAFGDTMGYIAGVDSIYTLTRGRKKYEATNHLGNVMVVFTDKRINQCINDSVQYYRADLRSAYDYYPFGMLIPDRTFDSTAYVQLPDRVDTAINQRIKIQIPTLNPGQIISLSKDGETYVLAQYQSGYTGAQYSAIIAGSAIVNELSFKDSAGYLIIENTTLGGQTICSGIPSFSLNIAGTNYVVNCNQSIDTIRGGLLSEAGYLFGFNTQERDDEIYGKGNSYSAEFWQYDSRLGRRWNVDPKPNFSISPYSVLNNSPNFFTDVLGDTVKGDLVAYNKVKNYVYNKISSISNEIRNVELNIEQSKLEGKSYKKLEKKKRKLEKEKLSYEKILDEYHELENSKQVYNIITSYSPAGGGNVRIDPINHYVNIFVNDKKELLESLPHELKHAYQFEKGKISLTINGFGGFLYDVEDEVEAYYRSQQFGFNLQSRVDANYVLSLGYNFRPNQMTQRSMSTPAYEGAEFTLGDLLIHAAKDAFKNNQLPFDLFIGWEFYRK